MARVQMTQAVAADYADAMLVARRAKNVLFFCLTLMLLIQLALFFVVRYVPGIKIRGEVTPTPVAGATASPAPAAVPVEGSHPSGPESAAAPASGPAPASVPWPLPASTLPANASPSGIARSTDSQSREPKLVQQMPSWPLAYVVAATGYLGVILPIVLSVVLLLILLIALVGKPRNLTGISHITGAFVWSIVLLVLLFPWQSLLNGAPGGASTLSQPASASPHAELPDMKIPGVLYTWSELVRDYDFPTVPMQYAILKWSRFVAFPVLSLIILLMIQVRSNHGWRTAAGDAEVIVDVPKN